MPLPKLRHIIILCTSYMQVHYNFHDVIMIFHPATWLMTTGEPETSSSKKSMCCMSKKTGHGIKRMVKSCWCKSICLHTSCSSSILYRTGHPELNSYYTVGWEIEKGMQPETPYNFFSIREDHNCINKGWDPIKIEESQISLVKWGVLSRFTNLLHRSCSVLADSPCA